MKAALCFVGFCLLAGFVSADFAWESGKTYKYNYVTRVMTGISEIDNKYTGLQLKFTLMATPMGENKVNIHPKNLKVVEVNEKMPLGWAEDEINEGHQVELPEQMKSNLTAPMNIIFNQGVVEAIEVSKFMPEWAKNIKKAMASAFTIDSTGKNAVMHGNLKRKFPPQMANQMSGSFWKSMEQTIHGKCEAYYSIGQNGPFDFPYQFEKQAQPGSESESSESASQEESSESSEESSGEKAWPKAFAQLCEEGDQVYVINKVVNFTACKEKPVLAFHSPSQINFQPGDNAGGSLWGRALVTRIVACGQSHHNFTILKITQLERLHSGLRDTEKVVAGAMNNITLLSIEERGNVYPVLNAQMIHNLAYEFNQESQYELQGQYHQGGHLQMPQQQQSTEQSEEEMQDGSDYGWSREVKDETWDQIRGESSQGKLPKPSMEKAPMGAMLMTPVTRGQMQHRCNELMQEIVEDLTKPTEHPNDSMANRETVSKISILVKALRHLDYDELKELNVKWTQGGGEQMKVGQNIFWEALNMAGANPAMKVLMDLMKSGQLSGEQATQIASAWPMYVYTPTKELLQEMFDLIEVETVKRQQQLRTTIMLSFSMLANQACVNEKTKYSRYPVALYGQFCHEQTVSQKYVPFFVQKLQKHLQGNQGPEDIHWITVLLKCLANFGTSEVVDEVQKILDKEDDPYIKVKAIFALQGAIWAQQSERDIAADVPYYETVTYKFVEKKVLPILTSVAFDESEHPEVRTAAISLLFHCDAADLTIWQHLAMSTWFKLNRSIHSFIYSALKSMANMDRPLVGYMWKKQWKARAVLPLVKPIDASLARSHFLMSSEFFRQINSGMAQYLQWIESPDSLMPNYVYYSGVNFLGNGATAVSPLEISLAGNTISKLLYRFMSKLMKTESQEALQKHPDMHQIRQMLNIQPREQEEPVVGSLYFNIRGEMQRMFTVDENMMEEAAKQISQYLSEGGHQKHINYQKPFQLRTHRQFMPTIAGIPVEYKMQLPGLTSIRGQWMTHSPSGPEFSMQADLQIVHAWKFSHHLAFKCPYTGKKYQAGVQRQFVMEAPFTAVARRGPHGSYQLAITPTQLSKSKPSGTIDLLTYSQKPYTIMVTDELYPVSHQNGGKMELVRAPEHPQKDMFEKTMSLSKNSYGLAMNLKQKSDFPEEMESASGWAKFFQRFHSPSSVFNAAWLGSPSIRYAERKLVLNMDDSETKTMVLMGAMRMRHYSVDDELCELDLLDGQSSSYSQEESSSSSSSESFEEQMPFQNVHSWKERQRHGKQQQYSSSSGPMGSMGQGQQGRLSTSEPDYCAKYHVAVALLGKKDPLVSLNEMDTSSMPMGMSGKGKSFKGGNQNAGFQKALQPGSPNTVQFLMIAKQNANYTMDAISVFAAMGNAANQAAKEMPYYESFQAIAKAITQGQNMQSQPDACVKFEGIMVTPMHASRQVLFTRRQMLLQQNLNVKVEAMLKAGSSCQNMPVQMQLQGKLSRDEEQTKWAESQSRKAKKCQQDERKGFSVSPVCMEVSEQQAAALNKWELEIKNAPKFMKKAAMKVQYMLQAMGWMNMEEEEYSGASSAVGKGHLKITGRMTPDKKFVSVHIYKPDSMLKFENMKTNQLVRTVLPPTATQTMYENMKDRLLRFQSDPQCTLESNWVSTFDNVTYSFNPHALKGCQTVLAKDCSGRYPMAVLVKNIQQQSGQVVTILIGGANKIQFIPTSSGQQQEQQQKQWKAHMSGSQGMMVKVNGHQVPLPYEVTTTGGHVVAEIIEMPNGGVQLTGRRIQVASDGKRIGLVISDMLRNRTCGICGDFDAQKIAEMRSPRDVPLSSGSLLVASYSFNPLDGSSQCQMEQELLQEMKQEEQQAGFKGSSSQMYHHGGMQSTQSGSYKFGPKLQPRSYGMMNEESSSSSTEESQSSADTSESSSETDESSESEGMESMQNMPGQMVFVHRAFTHPHNADQMCFTVNRVPMCSPGMEPKKMTQWTVKVSCMNKGPHAEAMRQQAKQGQSPNLSGYQYESMRIAVPKSCGSM